MKLLKVESDKGQFMAKDGTYHSIDEITKEDILRMIQLVLNEEVEFDQYDEILIKNPAHQIVYKSIYHNLISLKQRRQEFVDESERLYLEDYKRYVIDKSKDNNLSDMDPA
jgi:hypothetical protein